MVVKPEHTDLQKHIDYIWIVQDASLLFGNIQSAYDFPGTSPELIFLLDGQLKYKYKGLIKTSSKSILISYIDSFFQLNPKLLKSFIVIRFKPRSLASLIPFVNQSPLDLIENPIIPIEKVLNISLDLLIKRWKHKNANEIIPELEEWLLSLYNHDREGFVTELFEHQMLNSATQQICDFTTFSPSTLLRHFKKETGLSPKHFQSLKRFKATVNNIYETQNSDWLSYVEKYGYYDQSHFIKEIKRFSQFTPSQLIELSTIEAFRPL